MKRAKIRVTSLLVASFVSGVFDLSAESVWAKTRATPESSFKHYVNPRFKFAIDYPAFLVPQAEPDNGDGRAFLSDSRGVELRAFGRSAFATVDGSKWTIPSLMQDEISGRKERGDDVTYKSTGKDWLVLSGYSGNRIYYFKAMINADSVKIFEFSYPKAKKAEFDKSLERIIKSFKNTE